MNRLRKHWWLVGLLIALAVTFFSPLASPHPDGLERVAEESGFVDRARDAPYEVIPDYAFPGIRNENIATIAAGLAGTLGVFGLSYGLARLLRKRNEHAGS
jgi:hypothetical protein